MLKKTKSTAISLTTFIVLAMSSLSAQEIDATQTESLDSALPAYAEVDRLLLATEDAINTKNFTKAKSYLLKANSLNEKLPSEYYYFLGLTLEDEQNWEESIKALEQYVVHAGKEGRYYATTLKSITKIKESIDKPADQSQTKELKWEKENLNLENDYLKKIQSLYLTTNSKNALIEHINSLLSAEPYRGIPGNELKQSIEYSINISPDQKLLIQKKSNSSNTAEIASHKISDLSLFIIAHFDLRCSDSELFDMR